MRKSWNRTPMAFRAGLSLSGLLIVLFFLWLCLEWAVPFPSLALRLAERQSLFGPGQIAASGTVNLGEGYTSSKSGDRWYVVRSDGRTAVVTLERRLGFLWGGAYGRPLQLQDLSPESPLSATLLGSGPMRRREENAPPSSMRYLLCLCAYDDTIAGMDVTMAPYGPDELSPEERAAWQTEHAVTAAAAPAGDGVWTALVTLGGDYGPVGPRLRGYDAQGQLVCESSP